MPERYLPIRFPKAKKTKRVEDQKKTRASKPNNFPKGYKAKTGRPSILKTMPILPEKSAISRYKLY